MPRPLSADIDKESLARLPLLQRGDLDEKGKRVYDSLAGPNANGGPLRGPLGFAMYNPAGSKGYLRRAASAARFGDQRRDARDARDDRDAGNELFVGVEFA
jgi:hypothetical protein